MRIVLDTNILVRANGRARGPARELFQMIVASTDHRLVVSPFILDELARVLFYERVRATTRMTDEDVADYLSYMSSPDIVDIVFPGPAPRVVPADVEDDPIVHTAVIGQADVLCTLNRHFFTPTVRVYCRERGVVVATDVELLVLLRTEHQ